MRELTWLAVLLPALAAAAPQGAGAPPRDADRAERAEHMQKRMRLARAMALAEALDLDDAAALRTRDVLARYDEKRAPLRAQARDALRVVRDAAHGDQAAAAQVDAALQRARDARAKLQQLDAQMLDEVAKGLTPERKARAAMILARFHGPHHMAGFRGREGCGGKHGMGGRFGPQPGGAGWHAEEGPMGPGHDDEHAAAPEDLEDDALAGAF